MLFNLLGLLGHDWGSWLIFKEIDLEVRWALLNFILSNISNAMITQDIITDYYHFRKLLMFAVAQHMSIIRRISDNTKLMAPFVNYPQNANAAAGGKENAIFSW